MRTEYKIIKIVSKDQIKFLRREIDELIDNLETKHDNRVKVIIRLGDRLTATVSVIGQTPNLVRLVATTMHGLLSGLECKIKVQKPVLLQLQKQEVFKQGLWDIEQAHSCFFSMFALNRGKVIVHSIAANLEQIQKDVDNLINQQLATGQIIKLIGYSFKPLLRTRNNLMDELSIKYDVELTLDINAKHIKMYGRLGQMDKCREELLSKLTKASDDVNDCGICLGDIESKFILSICRHYFCQDCIIQSIKTNDQFPINCPTDGCNEPICLLDMMNLMNGIDIDKILDKSFKKHKTQHPKLYVQCITPDCEELFQNVDQFFHCQSCLSNFCKECKNSVHKGLTCEEHKANLAQTNQLTDEELKALNIKRCPGCQHGITKTEGCNHMYCKQCECHFCWICGHQAREEGFIYAHIKEAHDNNLFN